MYTDSQRAMMIGVPGTPIPTQTPAIKGASTCFPMMRPVEVIAVVATITVAMTVTAAILEVIYRPIPGASTNQVVLGTITLPVAGSAIGQQVYKRLTPFRALPGGEIVLNLTQASTAGAAAFGVLTNEITEHPSAVTAMVASA